jgi:polysaccharide biosynthesis/export protein
MKLLLLSIILAVLSLTSCSSSQKINRDFLYFETGLDSMGAVQLKEPIIQSNDLLSIQVFSKSLNQDQAMLFNLPNTGGSAGGSSSGYLVNMDGYLEVPLIGKVKAAGLNRTQLTELLVQKIAAYVKDPGVIVRFAQFRVNVLGEVKNPGTKLFQTDRITIIDAISAAGDLTEAGKREDILLIREENGQRRPYRIDLRSGTAFQSPVFQLQQNDVVYVGANSTKLKALQSNSNFQKDLGLALTITSFIVLIINLISTFK